MSATPAMVAAAQPGALHVGDALCDTCGDALIDDVVTSPASSAEADAAEVLLAAIQECSCEAWKLWRPHVAGAVPRPRGDRAALEDRMGYGRDGFVALGVRGDRPGPRRHGRARCGPLRRDDGRAHRVGAQRVEVTLTRDGAIVGSPRVDAH